MVEKDQNFKEYTSPNEQISPIDLIARDGKSPFFFLVADSEDKNHWIEVYARNGSWDRFTEDHGHGHGVIVRKWSFNGFARIATGGTIDKIEWGRWVEAKGVFVEQRNGVVFKIRG